MSARPAAIVTGASNGIGLAVTRALCQDGWAVTMTARREPRLLAVAADLRAAGHEIETFAADVAADGATDALLAAHTTRFGRLDLVVANAGWGTNGTAAESTSNDIDRMLRVNVSANFALARATIPTLRGGTGWFVITSSMSGVWPTAGFAGYSAAKSAAISLARSIAAEEASHGVRACAICPAFVDTDMTAWLGDTIPAEAMLDARDAAEAVRFLLRLSPSASVTELVLRRTTAPDQHAP